MQRTVEMRIFRWAAVACVAAGVALTVTPARAQQMLQLVVPQAEYKLGRFTYKPPQADGWRQIMVGNDQLALVYAERKSEEDEAINTLFGVTMEAHDIPDNVHVDAASGLADLSRKQMSDARKDDLVALSPIQAVPSIDNLYTYRFLVHPPKEARQQQKEDDQKLEDSYEVYYVLTAPDKSAYLVIQCITKTKDYENQLYFTQFYGSLASFKYDASLKKPSSGAAAPSGARGAPGATGATAKPADAAPAAH